MNLRAYWLLQQVQSLPDDFDTEDAIQLIEGRTDGSLTYSGITIKKMSGKLNRLCCMRFLERKKVKRLALTRNGRSCFRGYRYRYRITKQGHSYISYRAAKSKSANDNNTVVKPADAKSATSPTLPSSASKMAHDKLVQFLIDNALTELLATKAREQEQQKNPGTLKTANPHGATLAAFIADARDEIVYRNNLLKRLGDMFIRVVDGSDFSLASGIRQDVREILEAANNLPAWMR